MTDDDRLRFSTAYLNMAAQLTSTVPSAEVVRAAFDDVSGFDWRTVQPALEHLRTTLRFLPRPVQLISACKDEAHARAIRSRAADDVDKGAYCCDVCQDTGFERGLECPGTGVCHIGQCGERGMPNYGHSFTRKCACRATNRVLQDLRAMARRPGDSEGARP